MGGVAVTWKNGRPLAHGTEREMEELKRDVTARGEMKKTIGGLHVFKLDIPRTARSCWSCGDALDRGGDCVACIIARFLYLEKNNGFADRTQGIYEGKAPTPTCYVPETGTGYLPLRDA